MMIIMRNEVGAEWERRAEPSAGVRRRRRAKSRARILEAAARLARENGPAGVGVAEVMAEAGLTHGAFYVHFASKRALLEAAVGEAGETARQRYFTGLGRRRGASWLRAAVDRYLSPRHRDAPGTGCVFAAVGGDVAREEEDLRRAFEEQLRRSAAGFAARFAESGATAPDDMALATLALCAGGLTLSRGVADPRLSRRILRACRAAARGWLAEGQIEDRARAREQERAKARVDGRVEDRPEKARRTS
jgi:TetR/AcrR family transcriptional repressor of nem operon